MLMKHSSNPYNYTVFTLLLLQEQFPYVHPTLF